MNILFVRLVILVGAMATLASCGSAIDMAKRQFGYEDRDILVTDVKGARNAEDSAKQQFQTALQQFQAVTHFNGADLETEYTKLNEQYQNCEARAQTVSNKISRVQTAAADLFSGWEKELGEYSSPELRRSSQEKLNQTKIRYDKVISKMKDAEKRMTPVLAAFKDRVLFLKHNLNAAAIASLQTTSAGIDTDVAQLIKDMEASIAEADSFVSQLK